jgi:integrase
VKGHTYKRCPCGTLRNAQGKRINCTKKHGSWWYVHDVPPGADGGRRQARRGGYATERAAREALNDELGRLRGGTYVERTRVTVGEYMDEWLAGKAKLRATTRKSYGEHITLYFKPGIGHVRLHDLRDGHIEALYAAMRLLGTEDADPRSDPILARLLEVRKSNQPRPLSDASIKRMHATLMSALNAAVRRKRLDANPATHVEVPTGRRPKAVVWTEERIARWKATGEKPAVAVWTAAQTGRFLDAAADERLYPIFHLIAYRGLRRGEAVGLPWHEVSLDEGYLRITQTVVQLGWATELTPPKTEDSERVVSLDAGTVAVLRRWRTKQDTERRAWGSAWQHAGLVFTREDGSQLHPDLVTDTFTRLSAAAGLPPIRLHDLRHTAASLALQAGVPLKVVSEQLGHSALAITADTYTSVLPGVAQAAAEAVAGVVPRTTRASGVHSPPAAPFPFRSHSSPKGADMNATKATAAENVQVTGEVGSAPSGTRTPNPLIKSQLLCQLS